jgi:hypothetical protein
MSTTNEQRISTKKSKRKDCKKLTLSDYGILFEPRRGEINYFNNTDDI